MGWFDKLLDTLSFRENIPGLFLSSVIEGTAWHMYELVWQPYMISLGGTVSLIGLVISLWSVVTSVLQLFTGDVVDSIGRKPSIMIYYTLSILGLILAVMSENWTYFIPITLLFGLADALGYPSFNSIFPESVSSDKISLSFSLLTLTWSLPGFYSKVLGGYFGDRIGERGALLLILLLEVLSILLFYYTVEETLKERKPLKFDVWLGNIKEVIKPGKGLGTFYLVAVLDSFGWALNSGLFVTLLIQTHNYSLTQIGLLMTIEMTTLTLTVIPIGNLLDKEGSQRGILISSILAVVTFTGFSLVKDFLLFAVLQVFKGFSLAFWDPGFNAYLSRSVKDSERGRYYGNMNFMRGMISIPAPLLGALLFDWIGFKGPFIASAIVCVASSLVSFKLKEKLRD